MSFNKLQIIEPILKAIEFEGHTVPTAIQTEAIPAILLKKDILASAQTGTGKTAAFAIPILQQIYEENINKPSKAIKALILTPTRELATQVGEDFFVYSKYLKIRSLVIYGGVAQIRQTQALNRGTTILVATPGRLLDLINQGYIDLTEVEHFVLDEADQMLDMGFVKDVRKIIKFMPNRKQTLLFSATIPDEIIKLSNELSENPIRIEVSPMYKTLDVIEQYVYHVKRNQKIDLLVDLVIDKKMNSLLVFVRTKHLADKIVTQLKARELNAEAIHGDKSQAERSRILRNFKAGKTQILVATDIAARGLDIEGLSHVVNYDLPEASETYIHRIGRTGRAGASGVAISFCEPELKKQLKELEKFLKTSIKIVDDHKYAIKPVSDDPNNKNRSNRPKRANFSKTTNPDQRKTRQSAKTTENLEEKAKRLVQKEDEKKTSKPRNVEFRGNKEKAKREYGKKTNGVSSSRSARYDAKSNEPQTREFSRGNKEETRREYGKKTNGVSNSRSARYDAKSNEPQARGYSKGKEEAKREYGKKTNGVTNSRSVRNDAKSNEPQTREFSRGKEETKREYGKKTNKSRNQELSKSDSKTRNFSNTSSRNGKFNNLRKTKKKQRDN